MSPDEAGTIIIIALLGFSTAMLYFVVHYLERIAKDFRRIASLLEQQRVGDQAKNSEGK
jgi:hypothetical protein